MIRKNKISSNTKKVQKKKLPPKIQGECCICFNESEDLILNKNQKTKQKTEQCHVCKKTQ